MKPQQWREIENLFDAACDLSADEQAAFLAQACHGDERLRREVASLLAAQRKAGDFLASAATTNSHVDAQPQQRLGAYRLIREIAQGGMGAVWLAERADEQFEQQVAIKLLHANRNGEEVLRRFRHERQILAELNHPNIARLLDGGATEDGRPYFVMEYIEGAPIDEYCRRRQLSINERLTLFRQVCAAVHYAHQHLVIHRDLKPDNILVTADGARKLPKLLDFGIAKLLQPNPAQSDNTLDGLHPMTPAYASPEQVRGEKLTTASDVYALGVVLYELLTGRSPYRLASRTLGELTRAICEQEPERPSAAVTQSHPASGETQHSSLRTPHSAFRTPLRGDLDSIALMALRKEPAARYNSVEQFSEDIRRYLDGLPTLARKGTFGYRAVKFARRNKAVVAAAALVLLSLLGGLGATLRQAHIARAAQARAESEQAKADAQRQRAENALVTAEERRGQAEAARAEADEQSAEADAQRNTAEAQRIVADQQRRRAEQQELSNRRLLYTSRMSLAMQSMDESNIERARELLNPYVPQAGEPDFRGFEWRYLWKLAHSERQTLWFPGSVRGSVFSLDGGQLLTVAMVGTLPSGGTEVSIHNVSTGRLQHQFKFPPATITAISPDRTILAMARHGGNAISLVSLPNGKELAAINGLVGGLSCLELSSDGKTLVAGFYDGSLCRVELSTGRELYHIREHAERVYTVALSADGQQMVSASNDRSVKLWDATSSKRLYTLAASGYLPQNSLFSPDGRIVVVTGSGHFRAWEAASGKQIAEFQKAGRRVAFLPDGNALAIGGEDANNMAEISLLETRTWQETASLKGHGHMIMALAFSPDGKQLASGSVDQTVKLWEVHQAGAVTAINDQQRKEGEFSQVVLSPDGKRVLAGQVRQSATVFDAATGKEVMLLRGHRTAANMAYADFKVAVSADSRTYATGGADGQVKLWDASTGRELKMFNAGAAIRGIAFAPDGKLLAAGSANIVRCWDVGSGGIVRTLTGRQAAISAIVFNRDGKSLFIAGLNGVVGLWDVATGQSRKEFRCGNSNVNGLALSPDEASFATGNSDGTARLWDAQTGAERLTLKGHIGVVSAVAFSPDGKRLATGSQDKMVRLWDVETGQELIVLKGHTNWVCANSVSFSPDGRLLVTGAMNRIVKLWRAATEPEVMAQTRIPQLSRNQKFSQRLVTH